MNYSESLRKNKDFQHVYRYGTSRANRFLVIYVLKNQYNKNRLGISVSKKVGNSVVRHRITRLIRESYRINENQFNAGYDIVVIARNTSSACTFYEIQSSILKLAEKSHIIIDTEME